jgi:L-asparagine oxygenase
MVKSLLFSFLSPAPERLRLDNATRDAWTQEALTLTYPDPRDLDAWTAFRDTCAQLSLKYLPATMTAELWRFYAFGEQDSVRLENLPVDPVLPPVPVDGMRPANKTAVSEAVVQGLIAPWAEILSYRNEKQGVPIHEVTPIEGREQQQSNAGRVAFGYHSDNAFLPNQFRQEGILLYGLRNEDTATLVMSAEQIAEAASPALLEQLARPAFRHAVPMSYQLPATLKSAPRPILSRDTLGRMRVTAASSTIEPVDAAAGRALEEFRALIHSLQPFRGVVSPGTALVFKDDRVLHGRDTVAGERWLQRAYFRENLRDLRSATHSDPRAFCFDVEALLNA